MNGLQTLLADLQAVATFVERGWEAAERYESFCDAHEDEVRAELRRNPDDIMREEVSEYVSQNLDLWTFSKIDIIRGIRVRFEKSLEAAVKRALAAKYGSLS